jgi:tRNA nucleotidyltransferase/poly(A) polymerase
MPDYMFLLVSRLSAEQRAASLRVQELAQAQGINVYLAGGAVRDLISGAPIRDLDFVLEGNPSRIAREMEKGGARIIEEDENRRHMEMIFNGDVDGSLACARDDVYDRPGARPEFYWATITDDLRRRDFSMNAIALSLNPASRGLLLDPTNGLADIERREIRILSMHGFTNVPVRLLRAVRYCARLDCKLEERTSGWFDLAMERKLHLNIPPQDLLAEARQIGREENPAAILKAWNAKGLLAVIHPRLARKAPDYEGLADLAKARDGLQAVNRRPRLFAPILYYTFGRFGSSGRTAALRSLGMRAAEVQSVTGLEAQAQQAIKMLAGRKTSEPRAAFDFLERLAPEIIAFIQTDCRQSKVLSKIRSYLTRWKPLRLSLPAGQLEALGVARGPKFDEVLEKFFDLQLAGRVHGLEDYDRVLRKLAGIKTEPKKKAKEEKGKPSKAERKGKKAAAAPAEAQKQAAKAAPRAGKEAASAKPSSPKHPPRKPTAHKPATHKPAPKKPARPRRKPAKSAHKPVAKSRKKSSRH